MGFGHFGLSERMRVLPENGRFQPRNTNFTIEFLRIQLALPGRKFATPEAKTAILGGANPVAGVSLVYMSKLDAAWPNLRHVQLDG